MESQTNFTRELIDELAEHDFRPRAWRFFFARSWQRSREDISAAPALCRSFRQSAVAPFVAGLAVIGVAWAVQGRTAALAGLLAWLPWFLVTAVFVLLHIGMAETDDGRRHAAFYAPNQLSLARLVLAPLLLVPALAVPGDAAGPFFAAFACGLAISDLLDGWLARRQEQCSRLGQMLDYLGDLAFMTFLTLGLYVAGAIPASLFWLLLLRYPGTVVGALFLYFIRGPAPLGPTAFGRLTSLVLSVVLLWSALAIWLGADLSVVWRERAIAAVHLLLAANILHVIYRGVVWGRETERPGSDADSV